MMSSFFKVIGLFCLEYTVEDQNLEQLLTNCVQVLKAKFVRLKCHRSAQVASNSPDPSLSPPIEESRNLKGGVEMS